LMFGGDRRRVEVFHLDRRNHSVGRISLYRPAMFVIGQYEDYAACPLNDKCPMEPQRNAGPPRSGRGRY
jgi:hypothetical protein